MSALTRMNEIARETIKNETRQKNLSLLVDQFDPAHTSKESVINLVCHEILKKLHTAFEEDSTLLEFRKIPNYPPFRERIFYSQVEESVEWEIDKLPIKFLDETNSAQATKKPLHFRITSICTRIFSFCKLRSKD